VNPSVRASLIAGIQKILDPVVTPGCITTL
jgi:hypothetical protein